MSGRSPFAPTINTNGIADATLKQNFTNLSDYFKLQGQLDGFTFMEQIFTEAKNNVRVAHTQGRIPTDVILTQLTGAGSVTFNFGLFDANFLDITVTGACRVRFFFGVQGGNAPATNPGQSDAQTYGGGSSSTASTSSTGTRGYPGSYLFWPGPSAPTGAVACDGATYVRVGTYAAIFAALGGVNSPYGLPSSVTFQVPDFRGLFPRGSGTHGTATIATGGLVAAAALGTVQNDQSQGHRHDNGVWVPGDPASNDKQAYVTGSSTKATPNAAWVAWAGNFSGTTGDASVTDGSHGTPRVGAEIRPMNMSMLVCMWI